MLHRAYDTRRGKEAGYHGQEDRRPDEKGSRGGWECSINAEELVRLGSTPAGKPEA